MKEYLELFYGRLGTVHYVAANERDPLLPYVSTSSGVVKLSKLYVNPYAIPLLQVLYTDLYQRWELNLSEEDLSPEWLRQYRLRPKKVFFMPRDRLNLRHQILEHMSKKVFAQRKADINYLLLPALTSGYSFRVELGRLRDLVACESCEDNQSMLYQDFVLKRQANISEMISSMKTFFGRISGLAIYISAPHVVILSMYLRGVVICSLERFLAQLDGGSDKTPMFKNEVVINLNSRSNQIEVGFRFPVCDMENALSNYMNGLVVYPLNCLKDCGQGSLCELPSFLCRNLILDYEVSDLLNLITVSMAKNKQGCDSFAQQIQTVVNIYQEQLLSQPAISLEKLLDLTSTFKVYVTSLADEVRIESHVINCVEAKRSLVESACIQEGIAIERETQKTLRLTEASLAQIGSMWSLSLDSMSHQEGINSFAELIDIYNRINGLCAQENDIYKACEDARLVFEKYTETLRAHHYLPSESLSANIAKMKSSLNNLPERISQMITYSEFLVSSFSRQRDAAEQRLNETLCELQESYNSVLAQSGDLNEATETLERIIFKIDGIDLEYERLVALCHTVNLTTTIDRNFTKALRENIRKAEVTFIDLIATTG